MSERGDNQPPVQASRRRSPRAPLLVRKLKLEDNRKVFFGYGKNLSRGGIFIATIKPLEPGKQVTLELPLPPPLSGSARCVCEVVWKHGYTPGSSHEPGMGLCFTSLSQDIAQAIDSWAGENDPEKG